MPLKLVCIVQQGGVANAADVQRYLAWARQCGAHSVVFREFSRLGDGYRDTGSHRYVDAARVAIEPLVRQCMIQPWWDALAPQQLTEGYYYWNLGLRAADGLEVVFESSDYTAMQRRDASGDIYKLVFFADGRLCAGWNPDRDVLWEAADA